jgi:hypothetical protein
MATAVALFFVCFDISTDLANYRRDALKDFDAINGLVVKLTREEGKTEDLTRRVTELEEYIDNLNLELLKEKAKTQKPTTKLDLRKL